MREGQAPGEVGGQTVVAAPQEATDASHAVAHGHRNGPTVHDCRQPLLGEQRDDNHGQNGAEKPTEPDKPLTAQQILRPLLGMEDQVVDLRSQQATDHAGDKQPIDEVRLHTPLLELPVRDEPGRDEGKGHHDPERVQGETTDVEQFRIHSAPTSDRWVRSPVAYRRADPSRPDRESCEDRTGPYTILLN